MPHEQSAIRAAIDAIHRRLKPGPRRLIDYVYRRRGFANRGHQAKIGTFDRG